MSNDLLGLAGGVVEIERLAQQAQEKDFFEIPEMGVFTEKSIRNVRKDMPKRSSIELKNLVSLVELLKKEVDNETIMPIIVSVSETSVEALAGLDEYKGREFLYDVKSQNPYIEFGRYISAEQQIIQLKTCFKETKNRDLLIQKISKLSNAQTIEQNDDGISQSVTMKKGVSTDESITLEPLVKLVPQRSFYEIEQPEQMFLLRVNDEAQVALFDADGGAWKYNTQQKISDYLKYELSEMVKDGKVIVA